MTNDLPSSPISTAVDAANFGVTAGGLGNLAKPFHAMTHQTQSNQDMKTKTTQTLRKVTRSLAALLALTTVPAAFAASQTWSPTPTDQNWTTAANWVGNAVPGALNQTGNSVNNDVVTFNAPLPGSNIGTAGLPILVDDGTTLGARSRTIGGITFDTANCGRYIISSLSPAALPVSAVSPETGILNVCHNGSIQMTAAVTNSQVITMPIYVRLPSSTAGIYNLINNSTNPATLYISGITNDSANTRGTDFRLGGSNTGTNTIGVISAGTTTSGANGLTKQGTGTWILAEANDLRSQTVVSINDGTLVVKNAGAFYAGGTATINGPGVLQIDGVNLNVSPLNLNNGGTIRMNGTESLNGVVVSSAGGSEVTLRTTSASDVFSVGTGVLSTWVVSGGSASTVVHTAGPGTVALNAANTYAGNWSFDSGTNLLGASGVLGTNLLASAKVSAGAVFDFTPKGASVYVPTIGGFGGSGTGTVVGSTAATVIGDAGGTLDLTSKNVNLTFTPTAFTGDTTHPSLYIGRGSLTLGGNTFFINNASGTALGIGTYRLIQQASGSITSGGGYAALISGSGVVGGTSASIQVSGGNVDLVIVAYVPKNLVWSGSSATWDLGSTLSWLNGASPSVFNNSDNVTFNGTGAGNPTANLTGTLAPASISVDTSANDYTFTGAGSIAGITSLVKKGAGVLVLGTANTYAGGTVVSNGTLRVGIANAISSTGAGDVSVYSPGTIGMNGFDNTVNALLGDGTVDVQTGGASILTVGSSDHSGTFSGVLKNTSGTLSLTKIGTGNVTLTSSNSYSGPTLINAGTLTVGNQKALGVGDLTINAGTLNLQSGIQLNSLAGSGGSIANNANTSTNKVVITGATATTYGGNITDGTGGGGVGVTLIGASLTLSGNNNYTGGTLVGSGSTLAIPNSPAAVGGFVIASNNATLYLSGGSGTPGTPNSITTVDGAKVILNSGAEGKIWQAQFNGGPTATNRIINPVSLGQSLSFANFSGVVELANTNTSNGNIRFFNGGGASGGENTLFVFEQGNLHTRDAQSVKLGAIVGGNTSAGIGDQAGVVTWEIGAKNTTTTFQGYIAGVNNSIAKVGSGTLTLDGRMYYTNTVTLPDTSVVPYTLFNPALTYLGTTTVSNGTLKVVAPNSLTNSANLTMAGGTLDATQIGFATNQTTLDINSVEQATNSVVVTTGTVRRQAGQTLNGFGSILGSVTTDPATTVNVGSPIGLLSISGSISLNGTLNMDLNRGNVPTADRINAASFSGSGATLNITNLGATLVTGDTFQLFSGPVTAFTTVNLPVASADNSITYVWDNKIAVDGTIKVLSGASPVNATPTNITSTVVGNTLQLSWPSDRTGWTLQSQTNAISVGLSGTWYDVAGSTTTNQVFIPISPANPTVFYRLRLPQP